MFGTVTGVAGLDDPRTLIKRITRVTLGGIPEVEHCIRKTRDQPFPRRYPSHAWYPDHLRALMNDAPRYHVLNQGRILDPYLFGKSLQALSRSG